MKKIITIGIIALLFGIALIPSGTSEQINEINNTSNHGLKNLFRFQGVLNINTNYTGEPIKPLVELREITINVSYTVTRGSLFGGELIYSLYEGRAVDINLELIEYPEWATVELTKNTFTAQVPKALGEELKYNVRIEVSVNEDAPAFTSGVIYLKAMAEPVKGLFGIFTRVAPFEQIFSIGIMADYLNICNVIPESNCIETPPLNVSIIPIKIQNLGNGRTKFNLNITEYPDNCTTFIVTDEFILDSDSYLYSYLIIIPNENFNGTDLVKLQVNSCYAYDHELKGNPINAVITIFYDQ